MHHVFLKVKLKTLAAEARIIRRQIKIKKYQARYKSLGQDFTDDNACVATQNRADSDVGPIDLIREQLYLHKILSVRREARDTGLAYAFIRGTRYRDVERTCRLQPRWDNVGRMVKKYSDKTFDKGWYKHK